MPPEARPQVTAEITITIKGRCLVGAGSEYSQLKEDVQRSAQTLLEMHGMDKTSVETSARIVKGRQEG